MFIVQDILISDAVIKERFLCQLDACKGACCWEGDYGAPLEDAELHTLENIYDEVKPFLRTEGIRSIEEQGLFVYIKKENEWSTPLINNRECAFLTFEKNGVAKCGIEKAFEAGATDFRKPISCHLYPIRVSKNEKTGFEALNYDEWDICSAACSAGKKAELPLYRFVKDALVRMYGEGFYEELDAMAKWIENDNPRP